MADANGLRPWERQPEENDDHWKSFQQYRDQTPPRRIVHVGAKRREDVLRWYNEFRWKDRCDAYDRYLDDMRREQREAILKENEKERASRQLAQIKSVQDIVDRELAKLDRDTRESPAFGTVKVSELNKLIANTITLERLVRGESTENVGHAASDLDLEVLSVEELRQWQELHKKMKKGGGEEK